MQNMCHGVINTRNNINKRTMLNTFSRGIWLEKIWLKYDIFFLNVKLPKNNWISSSCMRKLSSFIINWSHAWGNCPHVRVLDNDLHVSGYRPHELDNDPHEAGYRPHVIVNDPHELGHRPHALVNDPHAPGCRPNVYIMTLMRQDIVIMHNILGLVH